MKPKPFSISKYFPILLLLLFLSFFAHLGTIPLFDTDEGIYSEVTREMVANNNFTAPLLNGLPFFHKPPLFYWAQAASIKILGLNEFGLRLPSAVAALLLAVSIFLFTRRFYDTKTAWFAGLYLTSSLMVVLIARAAAPEAMLNLFLTLTMLNIYRFYHTGDKRSIYWSFMFMAIGVLIKGSIAIILPVAASIIYFGVNRKWRQLVSLIFNPVGLIVFGLIVIPWYLGEYVLHGEAFLSELLLFPSWKFETYNLIGGFLPYYLYPAVIIIGLLPFSGMFIKAVFSIRKLLQDPLAKFMIIWFFLTLLLFPLVQSNSFLSLAYCFPPLFILMARVTEGFRHVINLFIWPLLFIASLFLILSLAPYVAGSIENEYIRKLVIDSSIYFETSYRLVAGAVILLLAALPFIKPVPLPLKCGILGLLFVSMINFLGLPLLGNILQQPIKTAGLQAKKENLNVLAWRVSYPSFNVYAERLTEIRSPVVGDIILTRSEYLKNGTDYDTLFQKHGIILAKILKMPAVTAPENSYHR
jgi:4-amino-4-deoxy-L-arabinose transferase-like glycosyltransferase